MSLSRYGIRSLDAVSPANSIENRRMAARFVSVFAATAGVVGLLIGVTALASHDDAVAHPVGVLIVATAVSLVTFLEAWAMTRRAPIWLVHVVATSAISAVLFAAFVIVGRESSFLLTTVGGSIVMVAVAMFAITPLVYVYALAMALGYALFLLLQAHPAPVAEAWSAVGSGLVLARVVMWMVDLSVRRAESDRQAREDLEVVSDRQSAFLGNMSHELRTPLNAIIGFSELLANGIGGDLNERQSEYVEDVRSSGQHLLALIDDVLDLAKVEEGRTDLELTNVDVPVLVTTSAALFREQAGRHGIAIDVVSADTPPIEADERKLRQVIYNLLSNAVRFTPDRGSVRIAVGGRPDAVTIAVTDSGPGIAADQRERIFEEYHQGEPAVAPRQPGTGLGLALVRKFVELHGGEISVKSSVGAGATFTVVVPTVRDRVVTVADVDPPTARRRWREFFAVRSIEGGAEPTSPENRRRVAELVMKISVPGVLVLTVAELLFMPVTHDSQYHPLVVLAVAYVGLMGAFSFRHLASRIPLGVAHPLAFSTTALVTVAAYFAGPRHPEVGFAYIAFGIASYAVFQIGGALLQTSLIGVCYAFVLAVQPGNSNALGRWLFIVPATTVASLAVLRLVGEMARLAESERRTKAQLEIVSRHKSEFLANMSHELRTPLNAIIGFSEVLRDELFGPLTAKQREYVEDILASGRHLLAVINDILDLAKLEAGRMPSDARAVALAPVLEGVARRRSLAVSCRPDASVVADEGQLVQLLDNLVAASPGAERLDVHVDDGVVRVRVERDGPPLFLDAGRAFEEFHRGTREGGTGLELPLARALADLHRGRLEVADSKQLELVLPSA